MPALWLEWLVRIGCRPNSRQHVCGFPELLLDEIHALVVGATRNIYAARWCVQIDLFPDQYDRAVVLQQDLVQMGDQEMRFARPYPQILFRDVGDRTDIVQEIVGITDAFVNVVRTVSCGQSRGRSPQIEVGVRGRFLRGAYTRLFHEK